MRPLTPRRTPALFLGLSLAAFAAASAMAHSDTPAAPAAAAAEPLRCEVALDAIRGGTRIEGRVLSSTPVRGTYEMQITSRMGGGRASITQSGAFEASPGAPVLLGETEMVGAPASHQVDLEIRVGSRRLTCAEAEL